MAVMGIVVGAGTYAQTVDFEPFWIRNTGSVQENVHQDGANFVTPAGGDKAGYGTHVLDGQPLSSLQSIDWVKDHGSDTSIPYLNIWFTDGTNYAIAAPQHVGAPDYEYRASQLPAGEDIGDLYVKVYEYENLDWMTPGVTTRDNAQFLCNDGVRVTFDQLASYSHTIQDPGTYGPWVGTGAPKNGTGLNIIYGDTKSNYVGGYKIRYLTVNGIPTAVPVTFTVNPDGSGDFTTIRDAIAAAYNGDTINVVAGTYAEFLQVTKGVALLGANAGIHPAVGTSTTEVVGARAPETILSHNYYAIHPAADNITVDGYKFTGAGGRIIDTYANANNFHLTNCIFDDPARAVTQGVIQFGGGSHTDMLIDYNLFQDQGDHTLYFGGGPYDRLRIAYNKFNGFGDGIFWAATPLVDGIVEGNEFDGTINGIPGQGGTGMNIGQGGNITIRNNWFHDMYYTGFQVGIVGGSVTGNTFENAYPILWSGTWYPSHAFELWGGEWGTAHSSNVTILENIVRFNNQSKPGADENGIRLRSGCDAPNIHIHFNSFIDGGVTTTALAIRNQGTGNVDATLNWWGDANGPTHSTNTNATTGSRVDDHVIFSPWLGIDPDGDPTTPGVQITGPMTIIVAPVGPKPTTKNGNTGYLDEGIEGSNELPYNDTIYVKHGTYDATEPITDPVNIISEPGSAAHTTLNGNMSINSNGVLIGLPLQGFRMNGNVTVGAGADAGTSSINWCDLYGNVTNNGTGTFDAQYNYWGTLLESVVDARTTGLIDYEPFLPENADDSYVDATAIMAAGLASGIDPAIDQLWLMVQLGQDVNTFIQYQGVAGAGAFAGAPAGAAINLAGAAGGGGAVEGAISGTYTPGEPIEGRFTLTDPVTGEPITDAAVTTSLLGPDGALVFWGCATYDETTGEYVFTIDTSGLVPGTYELIIQTDDGQSKTVSIEVQAA